MGIYSLSEKQNNSSIYTSLHKQYYYFFKNCVALKNTLEYRTKSRTILKCDDVYVNVLCIHSHF